jgi:hypothetical protein
MFEQELLAIFSQHLPQGLEFTFLTEELPELLACL